MVSGTAFGQLLPVASGINWGKFANDTGGVSTITGAGSITVNTSGNNLTFTLGGGTTGDRGTACTAIKNALNATHYMEVESLNGTTFILNGSGWTAVAGSKNQNYKWDDDTTDHSVRVRSTGGLASVTTLFGNIDTEGAIFRIKRR
jgi:hypothetical protein